MNIVKQVAPGSSVAGGVGQLFPPLTSAPSALCTVFVTWIGAVPALTSMQNTVALSDNTVTGVTSVAARALAAPVSRAAEAIASRRMYLAMDVSSLGRRCRRFVAFTREAFVGDEQCTVGYSPWTDASAWRAGRVSKNAVATVRAAAIVGAAVTADWNVWPNTKLRAKYFVKSRMRFTPTAGSKSSAT